MTAIRCDLILLSWNHLEATQPCLESLFRHTDVPCRLLIVDNGSEPDVRAFLQRVQPQGAIHEVTLLQNETNEGFPKGMNRGFRASRAPTACLLNNDLVFGPQWLSRLLEVAQRHPEIGILNPLGGRPPGQGRSEEAIRAHAQQLASVRGLYHETGMCIGFCMLIKRAVMDRIGVLSEEVERIFFEDEDYSMRAQEAGFRCVVVQAACVYHAEAHTVRQGPERDALFAKNRRWCEQKWGRPIRVAWPCFAPLRPGSQELRHWLEQLLMWARRRTYVHVYAPTPDGLTSEALFRSVDLVPHADIRWQSIPRATAPLVAAAYILKRRKKPFDVITTPTRQWGRSMNRLRWWHRADVVSQDNPEQLVDQWQRKSRSLSSS